MTKWKLYWVASDGYEDCFVVAKNSRSAKRIEKDMVGFEDDDLTVTKVKDIPDKYEKIANEKFRKWSIKNACNKHLKLEDLEAWPYYAEDWLLKKLGAEFRTIDGEKQTLIDDVVYSPSCVYPIGKLAMKELAELDGTKFMDVSNVSYEGIEKVIDSFLGKSITLIHDIENDITSSFVFAIDNPKYQKETIDETMKYWKEKLTFGKLIDLMEQNFIINEDVRNSFQLFLNQRNKITHGLTTEDKYDISTLWGQKEIIGYLSIFMKNAVMLKKVTEASKIASIGLGYFIMKNNSKKINKKLEKDYNDFYEDPYNIEQIAFFFEIFEMRLKS